jgi:hypothetical protein
MHEYQTGVERVHNDLLLALGALTHLAGGTLRIPRRAFESMPVAGADLEAINDLETGDIVLTLRRRPL